MNSIRNFDKGEFLAEYWQQKPLAIRRGIEHADALITPEELAGLACEEDIESRLVTHFDNEWNLTHGPIPESTFLNLPNKDWTVLVQRVEAYVPEVASLLEKFKFLPRWRIDDVMVSYATTGGTVSAHYDYYDVFLIQGQGSRKWQIGDFCEPGTALKPNLPMKILADFKPTEECILQPGDVLYIPPMLSHCGIALENCITYSVGFRAPSHAEIIDLLATTAMSQLGDDVRYTDTPSTLNADHFEINQETLEHVRQSIIGVVNDDEMLLSVMAEIAAKTSERDNSCGDMQNWPTRVKKGAVIVRSPLSRFSYYSGSPPALFADGLRFPASVELARFMCEFDQIAASNLESMLKLDGSKALITELLGQKSLQYEGDW
ncbi:MAG: cupin domain-containing protein [Pseudomonadota bacterium]